MLITVRSLVLFGLLVGGCGSLPGLDSRDDNTPAGTPNLRVEDDSIELVDASCRYNVFIGGNPAQFGISLYDTPKEELPSHGDPDFNEHSWLNIHATTETLAASMVQGETIDFALTYRGQYRFAALAELEFVQFSAASPTHIDTIADGATFDVSYRIEITQGIELSTQASGSVRLPAQTFGGTLSCLRADEHPDPPTDL